MTHASTSQNLDGTLENGAVLYDCCTLMLIKEELVKLSFENKKNCFEPATVRDRKNSWKSFFPEKRLKVTMTMGRKHPTAERRRTFAITNALKECRGGGKIAFLI